MLRLLKGVKIHSKSSTTLISQLSHAIFFNPVIYFDLPFSEPIFKKIASVSVDTINPVLPTFNGGAAFSIKVSNRAGASRSLFPGSPVPPVT